MKKDYDFNITRLRKLVTHYRLNKCDALKLRKLFNCTVTSIAYTAFGGFDSSSGEFYGMDRKINYQLRIKYKLPALDKEKFLLLKAEIS